LRHGGELGRGQLMLRSGCENCMRKQLKPS
jgi:hypothetical protein